MIIDLGKLEAFKEGNVNREEINQALEKDAVNRAEAIKTLDAIATQLDKFKIEYPQVFRALCEAALGTGEMTLGDAESALGWAADYLAEESA